MDYPFIPNKYTKWYFNIISQAKSNVNKIGYFEKHHIVPESLGGSNDDDNFVRLTCREHLICHLLLTKMIEDKSDLIKMNYAAYMMSHLNGNKINSRIFQTLREIHAENSRIRMTGRIFTEETRLKISQNTTGKKKHFQKGTKEKIAIACSLRRLGKKHSVETIEKMKLVSLSEEFKKNLSKIKLGIPRSEETKRRISESRTGITLSQEARDAIARGVKQRFIDHPVSEETRKKIGDAHRGKVYGDETRKKISAASKGRIQSGAKNWILLSPIGVEHEVYCLKRFCMENNLTWKPLSNSTNGIPIIKGSSKGWSVISRE